MSTKADVDVTSVKGAPELYLDLLRQVLTRYFFIDEEAVEVQGAKWRATAYGPVQKVLHRANVRLVRMGGDRAEREVGRDHPNNAETMVGLVRLRNVQECVTDVIRSGVPGDLIETGVWRGGTTIFMRAVLAAYGDTDRTVWVADSFQGLPQPDPKYYPVGTPMDVDLPHLAISVEQVKANFARYGLLDDQVKFLPGWFKDTLPTAPIEKIAVMRLDGDLYESTIVALESLYPKLSVGGYAIIDDFGCIDECERAVHDYRRDHGITDEIKTIDWTGAYWQRTS